MKYRLTDSRNKTILSDIMETCQFPNFEIIDRRRDNMRIRIFEKAVTSSPFLRANIIHILEEFIMIDFKQTTHRRGFLGSIAGGAAAIGIATFTAPFRLLAGANQSPEPGDTSEFENWLGKIKGKHRQVFDAPGSHEGLPLAWTKVFLMSNSSLGAGEDDVTAVIVLRHEAIPLAMTHDLWSKYKFGEVFKITDAATKAPSLRNPYYQPKEGELKLPGMAIEDLQKSGVLMGVCDMALTVYSMGVAEQMKMDAAEVKKDWIAGILPGIQLLPSGVLAVNRAQEHGCTYCFAG